MDPTSFASASASLLGVTIQIIGSLYGDWDHSSRLLAERLIYELSRLRNLLQSLEVATLSVTEAVIVPQELLIGFEDVKEHLVTLGAKLFVQDSIEVFSFRDYELPWRSFNAPRSAQSTKLLSTSGETLDEIEQLKRAVSKLRDLVGDAGFLKGDLAPKPIIDPAGALWQDCADYTAAHQSARESRVEGTGFWFVRRHPFRRWLVGERSATTLFCPGKPGSGKTILMSLAIDEVRRWQQDNPSADIGVAYFYFSYTKPTSIRSVALALLHQLYLQSSSAVAEVTQLEALAAGLTPPPLRTIISALLACANRFPKVYVILDALDECSPGHVSDLLGLLASVRDSPIRLLASSRPHYAFEVFENSPTIEMAPPPEDIERYVRATLGQLTQLVRHPRLYQEIITELTQAAEGHRMFLPIVLQAAAISRCKTPQDMRSVIHQLPRTLGSVYDETWDRIVQQPTPMQTLAMGALTLLHKAQRPLQTAELLDAIELGYRGVVKPSASEIVEACRGLLYTRGEIVTFVHFSVKEFLDTKVGHESIVAMLCLNYLHRLDLGEIDSPQGIGELLSNHPFLAYAASYWGSHIRNTIGMPPDEEDTTRYQPVMALSDKKPSAVLCHLVFTPRGQAARREANQGLFKSSWFHLAAHFGLGWAIKPQRFPDISGTTKDELGRTPAHIAAANSFPDCVRLLLQLTPESMSAKDSYGRTVWHYASMSGNITTLQLLLDLCSDQLAGEGRADFVEDCLGADEGGKSPLEHAAAASDPEEFRLLFGLYAASTGDYKSKALRVALEAGKADAISLLLSHGEPTKYEYLLEAVGSGFGQAVRILLEYGIELDNPDSEGDSAVLIAAREGRNKILQFLIWNGANIDRTGPDGRNALACAVAAGNDEAVQILLRAGVSPDDAMIDKERCIAYAAGQGMVATVEMFLNIGADSEGVATAATRHGQTKVLQKLDALGLLPDPASDAGRQLVSVAEEAGSLSVLQILQPSGTEVSPRPVYSVPYEESIIESEPGDLPPKYAGHEPPTPSHILPGKDSEKAKNLSPDSAEKVEKKTTVQAALPTVDVGAELTVEKTLTRPKVHVRQPGLIDKTPFLLLSDAIPADSISLGSIVADSRNPLAAYAPSTPSSLHELLGTDWDQSVQHNYQAKKEHESTSGFALEMLKTLLSSKSSSTEQSVTSIASEEVRRLQLRNHERVLSRILTDASVREEVLGMAKIRNRKELFIVVGLLEAKSLHTRMMRHSATNLGSPLLSVGKSASKESEMMHEGSSVFAISYRVIKIKTRVSLPGFSKKIDIFFENYLQPKAYERLL